MLEEFQREILEIPEAAARFAATPAQGLPASGALYIGMGASLNAAWTLQLAGAHIVALDADEAGVFLSATLRRTLAAVLISQSGRSVETVQAAEALGGAYFAVVNDPHSPLAQGAGAVVDIHAGPERFLTSSKSYTNTLLALYRGLGFDIGPAVANIEASFPSWVARAAEPVLRIVSAASLPWVVLGAGPNRATAQQAALTMMESTRHPVLGMSYAAFDHGPKEIVSGGAVVIALRDQGAGDARAARVLAKVRDLPGVQVFDIATEVDGPLSPIGLIPQLNLVTLGVCRAMGLDRATFLGGKVNEL